MQNTITMLPTGEREAIARRSAVMTIVYLVGIIGALAIGAWSLISFGSGVGLYSSIAASAAMSDPLRRHLAQLLD